VLTIILLKIKAAYLCLIIFQIISCLGLTLLKTLKKLITTDVTQHMDKYSFLLFAIYRCYSENSRIPRITVIKGNKCRATAPKIEILLLKKIKGSRILFSCHGK